MNGFRKSIMAVFGYGYGLASINTLELANALGTQNSTIQPNPSCCKDSAAQQYSFSAIDRELLLLCLNARYVTKGPRLDRTPSLMPSVVGCLIVLSQTGFVTSFTN